MAIPKDRDPIELFQEWYAEAQKLALEEPTAMTLATADPSGRPHLRVVLLKGLDERGFVFYTNLTSPKAGELRDNPFAALCFHWMPVGRQVRVEGRVEAVTDAEADAYFVSRPRQSQIAAWASKQSQPMETRFELEKRVAKYALKWAVGNLPRPEFWSGFRVVPDMIEFWNVRPYRLHDRVRYTRSENTPWKAEELFP
ncbi:MAG: pyridoxamine 5'-phosphate oxidase [FCB group bacterium]|jgi:pyridoxamine 5'-phosphate oxidase|nr:pyridoxamine 5'-phosphate oxidase [FCB group bacterium]